VRFLKGALTC
jgi:hypothetical protein